MTLSMDGRNRSYKMVQDAVNVVPNNTADGKRFVIRIKAGVYEEIVRVPLEKKNVVFLGDGIGKTVITGSLYVGLPQQSPRRVVLEHILLRLYYNFSSLC